LLHEKSVDEIAAKLRRANLNRLSSSSHVARVAIDPEHCPPSKGGSPEPVASISTNVASSRPTARSKRYAEHMHRTHARIDDLLLIEGGKAGSLDPKCG
jgi:hypothetical protein